MNKLLLLAALGSSLAPAVALADPWHKQLSTAADAVEDAYDRTQRSNGRCRNQIGQPLDGLVDRLDGVKKSPAPMLEIAQVRSELATLTQQAPYAACPIGVTEDLQRGLELLEEVRVALWNDPGRGKKDRRDRRRGDGDGAQSFFVQLAPIRVTQNVPYQNEQAVQISLPELRFEAMQGQSFYLATRFRSFEGDWSQWVTTQVWTVPSAPYVWKNAYSHLIKYSTLAEEDFSQGRFIVHLSVFNGQGQELAFREASFRVGAPVIAVGGPPPPPPPPLRRDCGTGPNDPGCLMVRDGRFAMDGPTFQGFLASMRANQSEMMRGTMAQSMLQQNYLTAMQLDPMLDLFSSEMIRLDFAQKAAPRVVNPQHAIGLSTKFRSSMMQTGYLQLMSQQPAGVQYAPGMVGPGGVMVQVPGAPVVQVQPGVVVAPGVVVQLPGAPMPAVIPAGGPPPPLPPGPPPPVAVAVARDCGTGNDPGCLMTRNGQLPMDAPSYQGLLASLRAVQNELVREDMFEKMIARNYLTAMQLGPVLDLFRNEITRMDVAKEAAPHVVNPQHAMTLSTKFPNNFYAEEFVEVYSNQR